ncbi:MAG: hypothetical protein LBH06_03850 [Rikenellaceae bacterium]|jgi:hypothetical protein|nr:hypothetical protein [Rikenellaceae bacterium]
MKRILIILTVAALFACKKDEKPTPDSIHAALPDFGLYDNITGFDFPDEISKSGSGMLAAHIAAPCSNFQGTALADIAYGVSGCFMDVLVKPGGLVTRGVLLSFDLDIEIVENRFVGIMQLVLINQGTGDIFELTPHYNENSLTNGGSFHISSLVGVRTGWSGEEERIDQYRMYFRAYTTTLNTFSITFKPKVSNVVWQPQVGSYSGVRISRVKLTDAFDTYKEIRHKINSVNDLYGHAEEILVAARKFK